MDIIITGNLIGDISHYIFLTFLIPPQGWFGKCRPFLWNALQNVHACAEIADRKYDSPTDDKFEHKSPYFPGASVVN